jgi:hypothetical protein
VRTFNLIEYLGETTGDDLDDTVDDGSDVEFQPTKKPRNDSEEPVASYTIDKDGFEVEDHVVEKARKRLRVVTDDSSSKSSPESDGNKVCTLLNM